MVDELARRHNLPLTRTEKRALVADGTINGKRVMLVKPQTFMNLSGEAVRALVDFYEIDLDRVIVIHDDLDIPLGTLRLRRTGGHGGQNGMRNLIQHLGTKDFSRVRFGIGRPPGKMNAVNYVLTSFKGDDEILAREVTDRAADAVEYWLREGIDVAMTQYNGDIQDTDTADEPSPEEQLKVYLRAHELAPNDPKPLELLVGVLKRIGDLEEAARRHVQLGDIFMAQGKPNKALPHWERATSLNPDLLDIQRRIATTYEDTGNLKKAIHRYVALGQHLEKRGDINGAFDAIREALRINPQHPKPLEAIQSLKKRVTE